MTGHDRRLLLRTALRLLLPPILTIGLFIFLAFWYFIPTLEESFLRQKRENLRDQVRVVLTSLTSRQEEVDDGVLGEADARDRALRRLRDVRYGEERKDYFWILDTGGRLLMHPYRRELEGENVLDYRDRHGVPLFAKMREHARNDGAGFVRYEWQWKDEPGRLEPKLSYVELYEPWGWIVGSGVYLEDVESEIASLRAQTIQVAIAVLIPVVALGGIVARQGFSSERRRRRAEADLRRSEAQFRSFVVNANDLVYALDKTGIFTYVSPNWTDMLGHDPEEVQGRTFRCFVHPDDVERCAAFLREVLASGEKKSHVEYRVRRKDGSWRWHESNGSPVYDEEGNVSHYVGIARDITEQKRMREQIEQQVRFRASLLEAVAIPLYYKDRDERYLGCNPAYSDFVGIPEDDLRGRTAGDIFPASFAEAIGRSDNALLHAAAEARTGHPACCPIGEDGVQHYETAIPDRAGRLRNCLFTKAPFRDSRGEVAGLIGTFVDITDLRAAEAALRVKERRHAVLFAASRTMQFVLDREGTLLEFTPLAEEITGVRASRVEGRRFDEAFLHDDGSRRRFAAAWRRLPGEGEFRNVEVEMVIAGGWRRTVVLNAVQDADAADGSTVLMSGQDVTALRVAQQRQRTLEERLREILARAPVVLQIMDRSRRIVYCTENVRRIFGVAPERLTEAPDAWRTAVHPGDRAAVAACVADAFGSDEPQMVEFRFIAAEGDEGVWARARLARGRDPASGAEALTIVFVDIDDEKTARARADELQAQLLQSEKLRAIGELAGGIAHDFNNLLAGIMGSAELLLLREGVGKGNEKYVERIIETSNQAALLIQQIKTFARKTEVERRPMDVHEAIRAAVLLLKHTLDRRIRIEEAFEASDAAISGDSAQLRSAILNLAVNARDAMPEGGVLSIRTADETVTGADWAERGVDLPGGSYLRVDVADTGVGMPPDVQERVFEPFYTTKAEGKGMGLGLASVYGCIQMHGGHIALASAPGEGTTFSVYLPRMGAPGEAAVEEEEGRDYAEGVGRIAVIDDEPLVRQNAAFLLRNLGYEVEAFPTGPAFFESFRAHADAVDAVLLDMIMPEMRGEEVFREIRRIRPDAKVIVTTGYAEDETLKALRREGISGVLAKPFRLDALSRLLADVLKGDAT